MTAYKSSQICLAWELQNISDKHLCKAESSAIPWGSKVLKKPWYKDDKQVLNTRAGGKVLKGRHPRNNPYEFQVTEQVTELWNRLPREVIESPFLGILKSCLDMVLFEQVCWTHRSLPTSTILWCCKLRISSTRAYVAKLEIYQQYFPLCLNRNRERVFNQY